MFKADMYRQAEILCGFGFELQQIANILGVSPGTISRWQTKYPDFHTAIKRGTDKANTKVIQGLFRMATEQNNLGAAIFWLKNRAGWKDDPKFVWEDHRHVTTIMQAIRMDRDGNDGHKTRLPQIPEKS